MRLIGTFQNENELKRFSEYLKKKKIDHSIEEEKVSDWGSDDYGTLRWQLWVFDEDTFENVYAMYQQFKLNPDDPIYPKEEELARNSNVSSIQGIDLFKKVIPEDRPYKPFGQITLFFLLLCCFLFFLSSILEPNVKNETSAINVPTFLSPVNRLLMFDFPTVWDLYDQLIRKYGIEALAIPSELPPEGRVLYQKIKLMPFWNGAYDLIVNYLKTGTTGYDGAPLFVKIREGQFWRLFTPALLHFDIFHLFFNMIWLLVLGRQIEDKIGQLRYLLLILFVGVVSNICQYLMSGPSFIGFSGIVCGFIGFVYARQQKAPWEGYQMQRSTFLFVLVFVLGIAAVQFVSFLLEVLSKSEFSPPIASTAHIIGGIIGYLLGRLNRFSWKISNY